MTARSTKARIDAALRAAGIDATIVRGTGYVYFTGPATATWYTTSVSTPRLSDLTVGGWVDEARRMAGRDRLSNA